MAAVDRDELLFVAPRWALEAGEDRFGLFAGLEVTGVVQRFRWIPPGSYRQGSPETEAGSFEDEAQRLVTFTKGFWMGETPVTQRFYEAVTGKNPSRFRLEGSAGRRRGELPVESVSFDDVQEFLGILREQVPEFKGGLPSEAEWEYACRAGSEAATYAGDLEILGRNNAPALDPIAWYAGNCGVELEVTAETSYDISGVKERQDRKSKGGGSHAVKRKGPNGWGLYDMLGNVWEWCEDRVDLTVQVSATDEGVKLYPRYPEVDVSDPEPRREGSLRVLRGGSWLSFARGVRAACRDADVPGFRDADVGFRLSEVDGCLGSKA